MLWRNGPAWLKHEEQWPIWKQSPTSHLCALAGTVDDFVPADGSTPPNTGLHYIITITKYSTLLKLLAVTSYVLRFIYNSQHRTTSKTGPLSAEELHAAKMTWLFYCQQEVYWQELNSLKCSTSQKKKPLLIRQLRLFLDSDGFICCGGRIHNAPISELARFPYLLPAKHPLTKLIITELHIKLCHCGLGSTVTALRQIYWVPTARQTVKSTLRQCTICRRHSGKPYKPPDPAPLPKARLQDVRPFTVTGVDFTGALYVKRGNEEVKAYVCLFGSCWRLGNRDLLVSFS